MRAIILCEGNDGHRPYKPGDEYVGDSEWLRKQLVNGLATPLDEEAQKVIASPQQLERYGDQGLANSARELGIKEENIPSAAKAKGK